MTSRYAELVPDVEGRLQRLQELDRALLVLGAGEEADCLDAVYGIARVMGEHIRALQAALSTQKAALFMAAPTVYRNGDKSEAANE